jgi:uncharacterized protein YndB with AHSA1/START domain
MTRDPQWQVAIVINAPVARVWEASEDLSLIPSYHPVVKHVEYVSGGPARAPGVAYKCIIPEGPKKGWCVERVVEHVPMQKTSVSIPEDSWGMSRMLDGFLAEATLEPSGHGGTLVRFTAYYAPRGLVARLANLLFLRRMMSSQARLTLEGLRRLVESRT